MRKKIKKLLYGKCPGFAGSFPYFGTKVYFPPDSLIFAMACEEGIYEHQNSILLRTLVKPGSTYFDIGANIGLMSIPILRNTPDVTVVSVEPSPNTLPYLMRTVNSSEFIGRWLVIDKAFGNRLDTVDFHMARPGLGALDGLADTKRTETVKAIRVSMTTLDHAWETLGRPTVSVIKIDVEGAETKVLQGAIQCINQERPFILTEWNNENLRAYDVPQDAILKIIEELRYNLFSVPHMVPVKDRSTLFAQMLVTEYFLLVP